MGQATGKKVHQEIETIYLAESRRIFASLIRLLGDFDLAEEGLQESFRAAIEQWPKEGIPARPRQWLISTGRFKAIDSIRRRNRFDAALARVADQIERESADMPLPGELEIEDDRLRLIFTCCHPSLSHEARLALTLREVCGLSTEEIAHAFLIPVSTLAQRIVRAKARIRDRKIPYEVPARNDLAERLDAVLHVIYLIFNEGYVASEGKKLTRPDLSGEAIRLGRLLVDLLPETEAFGLLALMLLNDSRRLARTSAGGDLVLLEEQDRALWNQSQIVEGASLVQRALASDGVGPYTIQAAIAAAHATAPSFADTNWGHLVELYDLLLRVAASPIVELNRAVAVAMLDGAQEALPLVDKLLEREELAGYHRAHAVRAELYRQLGRQSEALLAYQKALLLARQEPERRYLEHRIKELADEKNG